VPFSREIYIERDDFMEAPPKKFFRLSPGAKCGCATPTSSSASRGEECRRRDHRAACDHRHRVIARNDGGRRVKGTIHWVSAAHAVDADVRLYDRLFQSADPGEADAIRYPI
jgi:glutaminyl-tRNA synthetase